MIDFCVCGDGVVRVQPLSCSPTTHLYFSGDQVPIALGVLPPALEAIYCLWGNKIYIYSLERGFVLHTSSSRGAYKDSTKLKTLSLSLYTPSEWQLLLTELVTRRNFECRILLLLCASRSLSLSIEVYVTLSLSREREFRQSHNATVTPGYCQVSLYKTVFCIYNITTLMMLSKTIAYFCNIIFLYNKTIVS